MVVWSPDSDWGDQTLPVMATWTASESTLPKANPSSDIWRTCTPLLGIVQKMVLARGWSRSWMSWKPGLRTGHNDAAMLQPVLLLEHVCWLLSLLLDYFLVLVDSNASNLSKWLLQFCIPYSMDIRPLGFLHDTLSLHYRVTRSPVQVRAVSLWRKLMYCNIPISLSEWWGGGMFCPHGEGNVEVIAFG